MWVRFVSDAHITRRGFLAKLSASPKKSKLYALIYANNSDYKTEDGIQR